MRQNRESQTMPIFKLIADAGDPENGPCIGSGHLYNAVMHDARFPDSDCDEPAFRGRTQLESKPWLQIFMTGVNGAHSPA